MKTLFLLKNMKNSETTKTTIKLFFVSFLSPDLPDKKIVNKGIRKPFL